MTVGRRSAFTIDIGAVNKLAKSFKTASPAVAKSFRQSMREAADVVVVEAKVRASFSTKIPRTIHRVGSVGTLKIQAGGDKAPNAAPLENRGREGTFRHPVFAKEGGERDSRTRAAQRRYKKGISNHADDWVWVDQPAHPFLTPALEAKGAELLAKVDEAIDLALHDLRAL